MAAIAEKLPRTNTWPLRAVPDEDPKEIVAVVLADGSVKDLRGDDRRRDSDRWASGSLSGRDWVLWCERRSFPAS